MTITKVQSHSKVRRARSLSGWVVARVVAMLLSFCRAASAGSTLFHPTPFLQPKSWATCQAEFTKLGVGVGSALASVASSSLTELHDVIAQLEALMADGGQHRVHPPATYCHVHCHCHERPTPSRTSKFASRSNVTARMDFSVGEVGARFPRKLPAGLLRRAAPTLPHARASRERVLRFE